MSYLERLDKGLEDTATPWFMVAGALGIALWLFVILYIDATNVCFEDGYCAHMTAQQVADYYRR